MNYEKLYKEALERAKYALTTDMDNSGHWAVKYIFPELKESEDERIRKGIIDFLWKEKIFLQEAHSSVENNPKYRFVMDAIAWLEKQKSVGEIVERCKNSWYNEGKIAGMAEGLTNDEKYQQGWHDALEKQDEKKAIMNVPTREVILAIWDLGNEWKELTNGCISTEHCTQLDYIQNHWHESEYYLKYLKETKDEHKSC